MPRIASLQFINVLHQESLKHRAPNVLVMITRFNAMSMWAAASILWKQTIKERVALWVKLVNITEVWLAHSVSRF